MKWYLCLNFRQTNKKYHIEIKMVFIMKKYVSLNGKTHDIKLKWEMCVTYMMQSSKVSLKLVKFSYHFSDWVHTSFAKLPFTSDPIEIGQMVPKIQQLKSCKNNLKKEETTCFVWLYLKICISKFQLILLDHITCYFWWEGGQGDCSHWKKGKAKLGQIL